MTQSLSLPSNGAAICCLSRLPQPTDGELIGVAECSCAGCRTVRALNQKVSLLLIIHNATNSRHLSFPPASLNILAATQRGRKKGEKRTIYTQLSQWDEQTFVWMTISAEGWGGAS